MLNQEVRVGLLKNLTCEQSLDRGEGMNYGRCLRSEHSRKRGNSKCKGPVVSMCLGARRAGAQPPRERVGGNQVREMRTGQVKEGLGGRCRVLAITLRDVGPTGRCDQKVVRSHCLKDSLTAAL